MLTAVIVEDEAASRETLEAYIKKYCQEVKLLGSADSVKSGFELIKKYNPDIVFLDIEMPHGNAFDLLEQVENINFATIFVTAFSNYAIKALNFSASYYILKPIDIDELIKAIVKVKEEKKKNAHFLQTKVLIENIQSESKQSQKLVLPLIEGFEVVKVGDIIRCKANNNFTYFYFKADSKQLICRTLKFYEDLLCEYDFVRVHKSHLVNMQHIKRYKKGKGGQLVMNDDSVVDVSANKKKDLMLKFKLR